MRAILFIAPLITSAAWIGICFAENQPAFTPAEFDRGSGKFIGKKIELPDSYGDISVLIRCIATINRAGRMNHNHCFPLDDTESPYARAIEKAARKSRVSPANANGKKTKVQFNYLVRIKQSGSEQVIRVYPNWGINFTSFGTDYTQAQPYLFWNFPIECRSGRYPFFVLTSVLVRVSGLTQEVEMYSPESWFSHGCRLVLERYALDKSYIPAFADGHAVDSQYLEPWWRNTWWETADDEIIMPGSASDFEY